MTPSEFAYIGEKAQGHARSHALWHALWHKKRAKGAIGAKWTFGVIRTIGVIGAIWAKRPYNDYIGLAFLNTT